MNYINVISLMKKSSFEEAFSSRVSVFDKERNVIGFLVPVGEWILSDEVKIEQIRLWRQRTMRMFLTQFESTFEKTFGYLKNLSIEQQGRMFFLLYDDKHRFVGHIGIAGVDGKRGELDNLVRGVDGGNPRLVYFAEVALLHWCFQNLGIVESDVRVISYNWLVLSLHEEIGYQHIENIPLKKITKDGVVFHEPTNTDEANVNYSCTKMLLNKDVFYEINDWVR
ncbi:MAG: hypothetical protein ACK5GU_05530 [Chloroflexota bacterium]